MLSARSLGAVHGYRCYAGGVWGGEGEHACPADVAVADRLCCNTEMAALAGKHTSSNASGNISAVDDIGSGGNSVFLDVADARAGAIEGGDTEAELNRCTG
jgi:hypothetical protein